MRLKNFNEDEATIVLPIDELAFLCRAISETFEAVPMGEFELRTGEKPERASAIRQQLRDIGKKIEKRS